MFSGRTNNPKKVISFSYGFIFITWRQIIYIMRAKSSAQRERLFLPDCANCIHVGSRFPPNCSTFAVECDWLSNISQNMQNLVFFLKLDGFFSKKMNFFPKSLKVPNVLQNAYQTVIFNISQKSFSRLKDQVSKNQKTFKVRNTRKFDGKSVFFFENERF